jgi:murein DD-endopeptidase MepM/ murein hydrolase activator NlpD
MALSLASAAIAVADLGACQRNPDNPYETASPEQVSRFKRVRVPLQSGTSFVVSQGAFGRNSHRQKGIEYRWDLDVPYGTPVVTVEDGVVIGMNDSKEGGCDPKFAEIPGSVLVRHSDGTVAQYVHVERRVDKGQGVSRGQIIAVTAKNGFHCTPQLDFLIFRSEDTLFNSPRRESIPLRFEGLPKELAVQGYSGTVP